MAEEPEIVIFLYPGMAALPFASTVWFQAEALCEGSWDERCDDRGDTILRV